MKHSIYAGVCIALPLAQAISLSSPAAAQGLPLPGWKISDICAKESAPGQCAAFEGTALKSISATWPLLLDQIKDGCVKQLSNVADHSWRELADCVNNASFKAVDGVAVKTARTPSEPVPPPRVAPPALAPDLLPRPSSDAASPAPQMERKP